MAYMNADDSMPESDRRVAETMLDASRQWWENAGVEPRESALYDLGVYMLAASWFEMRGAASGMELRPVPNGVYSIKHQLEE